MKTAVSYIMILLGLAVLCISTSRKAMEYIWAHRQVDTWWGAYDWKNGNLVGMSHLDFVRKFVAKEEYNTPRPVYSTPKKNTVLYLQGDSNTRHPKLKANDFAGVNSFNFIERHFPFAYHLDTTKNNVLVIAIAEFDVRNYFSEPKMLHEVSDTEAKKEVSMLAAQQIAASRFASLIPGISIDILFNKYINQNLECNLFNYNFMMPMFSLKAGLNYYLFNRATGDVVISEDRNLLFSKQAVSYTDIGSAYSKLKPGEIDLLVNNLNLIYDHFKAAGFHEVYLSVIPWCPAIMQPREYNNLVPQLYSNPQLKMPVIDLYTTFKNTGELYYLPGDTHWNEKGFLKWLALVNERLLRDTTISN